MKALIFDRSLKLVEDYPVPARNAGESLIRIRLAGICNTDLEIARGYMSYRGVVGHEFVGSVEETDSPGLRGKRVVGEINVACGRCALCRSGLRTHCPDRTVLGIQGHPGAMAQFVVLPDVNLHEVPPNVADQEAVFTEPLAAAFEILAQVAVRPDQNIVVLGDGKLGLLAAQALNTTGAAVSLMGRSKEKLSLARRLGLNAGEGSARVPADFADAPHSADIVVDCTGSPEGLPAALRLVRPRGTIVLKTTVAAHYSIDLAPVVIHEITVQGSRCGPFEPALQALASGTVRVKELVTGIFPFEEALEAFARACEPDALKILLSFPTVA